jgi:hypothetical protein
MKNASKILAVATFASVLAPERTAIANCAAPQSYEIVVRDSTVAICPSHDKRPCPDFGLIREEIATGERTLIRTCLPEDLDDGETLPEASVSYWDLADELFWYTEHPSRCFVDECAQAGNYRYGLVKPFECCPGCCGTAYFSDEVTVAAFPTDCVRHEGVSPPENFVGEPPWRDDQYIAECDVYPDEDPDDSADENDGGCSCASVGPVGQKPAVFGSNATVALLGVWLFLRRKKT